MVCRLSVCNVRAPDSAGSTLLHVDTHNLTSSPSNPGQIPTRKKRVFPGLFATAKIPPKISLRAFREDNFPKCQLSATAHGLLVRLRVYRTPLHTSESVPASSLKGSPSESGLMSPCPRSDGGAVYVKQLK